MPIKYGRKHGNGYHGNTTRKVTVYNINKGECYSDLSMRSRINNGIIIVRCPETCGFFEKCIAKSGEVKK